MRLTSASLRLFWTQKLGRWLKLFMDTLGHRMRQLVAAELALVDLDFPAYGRTMLKLTRDHLAQAMVEERRGFVGRREQGRPLSWLPHQTRKFG